MTGGHDPNDDKTRALRHAALVASTAEAALRDRDAAILLARESGASLREIAEASGIAHMTVKRIIQRAEATK